MMRTLVAVTDLKSAVEGAFAMTGRGLARWPDPHTGRAPSDDEYSRVTDADKWRLVGARADAWLLVLDDANLAHVERDATVQWAEEPGTRISKADRVVPRRREAVPMVIARSAIGDVHDAGVTFGVGDPAVCVAWLPNCGCDACDSGSQNELDKVDRILVGVVSGAFRRLTSGGREITQFDGNGWSASGSFGRRELDAVLSNPEGWQVISGAAWIDEF